MTSRQAKIQEDTNYRVMRMLEENPDLTQRELAEKLGVSVGGLNYCLKALTEKGLVKMQNFANSKNKFGYVYVLTPRGIAEKAKLTGSLSVNFVQDNHSKSTQGVLRGLHYQIQHPQGKLVRVTQGSVFDVAVDMRRSSPHFGKWVGVELSEENKQQMWIPPGFAHGFMVTSESAEFLYKTTDYWYPEHERSLLWNDLQIGIKWPINAAPKLASKDVDGTPLALADTFD